MPYTTKSKILRDPAILEISPEQEQRAYLNILEDMQTDKQTLKEQRIATFNILEDVQIAQEALKESYRDLEVIKNLVHELSASLNITMIIEKLIRAVRQTLPEATTFSYCIVPADLASSPTCQCFIYAQTIVGSAYLNTLAQAIVSSLESAPNSLAQKEQTIKWIRETISFEVLGGLRDDASPIAPRSSESIPIVVGNELLGIVNISSPEQNYFTQAHRDLLTTITGVTATTISRLRQLLDSEQSRVQTMVENLSNGVVMFDLNRRVTLSNPAAQKMTGLPAKGFYLSELQKLFKYGEMEQKITQVLQGIPGHITEIMVVRFTYEFFIVPIRDSEGKIVGGALIIHDITYFKDIDRMKTDFISVASHQLRTPLTGIRWVAEMMIKKEKLTDKGREYLNDIETSTRRLSQLVDLLLNTSRIEEGQITISPQPLDVVNLVKSFIGECAPVCDKKGITLKFTTDLKNLMVMTDLGAFTNIIQSIISNAMEYTFKGRIEVKLSAKGGSASGEKKQGQIFLFTVSDTGVGIPKEEQKKIFQKFGRASNAQYYKTDGTGLGLYIAKQAVELLGGKIWFESPSSAPLGGTSAFAEATADKTAGKQENKGTTFFVELPIESKSIQGTKQLV